MKTSLIYRVEVLHHWLRIRRAWLKPEFVGGVLKPSRNFDWQPGKLYHDELVLRCLELNDNHWVCLLKLQTLQFIWISPECMLQIKLNLAGLK